MRVDRWLLCVVGRWLMLAVCPMCVVRRCLLSFVVRCLLHRGGCSLFVVGWSLMLFVGCVLLVAL